MLVISLPLDASARRLRSRRTSRPPKEGGAVSQRSHQVRHNGGLACLRLCGKPDASAHRVNALAPTAREPLALEAVVEDGRAKCRVRLIRQTYRVFDRCWAEVHVPASASDVARPHHYVPIFDAQPEVRNDCVDPSGAYSSLDSPRRQRVAAAMLLFMQMTKRFTGKPNTSGEPTSGQIVRIVRGLGHGILRAAE
jgi:hypothetical protein